MILTIDLVSFFIYKNMDKYFRTKNYYLSCYLFAKDQALANIDKIDPKRAEFIFVDSPELQELVESFNYSQDCTVNVHKYTFAVKSIKAKLYSQE